MTQTYRIVRLFYRSKARRTIARGLTLEQAQAHCRNPETSSSTCIEAVGRRRTARLGPWFDSFSLEGGR